VTASSEPRVPSDQGGRGSATPPADDQPAANGRPKDAAPVDSPAVDRPAVGRSAVRRPAVGRSAVGEPLGAVYLSKHAIRSLIRSETETVSVTPLELDIREKSRATNPAAEVAPNDLAVDTTTQDSARQDPAEVPAPDPLAAPQGSVRVRRKGLVVLPLVVAALTAFVVAVGYLAIREPHPPVETPRWGALDVPSSGPDWSSEGRPNPFGNASAVLQGAPTRLKVKAIGVDTALETLKLGPGGELDPPKDFAKAGWYADGTAPGDLGPAVIAGHVDNKQGPAVFFKLRELVAGDRIQVTRGGQTVTFTVTSTAWYPKKAFPSAKVYGPTPDRQLRLITCGGVFDHSLRSYKDNLVVYAVAG